MNVLIDTNILLDFITKREPFFDDAKKIIEYHIIGVVMSKEIDGTIREHSNGCSYD